MSPETLPETSPSAVSVIAEQLRRAQPEWEALGARGRAVWLRRLRDWLLDEHERITDVIQAESGKTRAEAIAEVPVFCELLNYFAAKSPRFLADERPRPSGGMSLHKRLRVLRRPFPLVGVIAAWNFPLANPGLDVVPALAAGCAVLLKPSELSPLSAQELARGWAAIGAPPVLAVVTGAGKTGAAVVDEVDFVQFTGSTATGRRVAAQAAARLIPYSLELGGKDAAIVLADADLDRAVPGIAWGALFNAGQVCVSIERVYVEAAIYPEFVRRLTEEVASLRAGVEIGMLASEEQADIVERHIVEAQAAGAQVLIGGKRDGVFVAPTVLVDVDHTMSCMGEETFGPTIPVFGVADEDQAVRLVNDSSYGLSASVWTRDHDRGLRVARRLEVGAVNVNDAIVNVYALSMPHAGWKSSGIGARFGGAHGVLKYTRPTAVTVPRLRRPVREPGWFPYDEKRTRRVRRLLRVVTARGRRRFTLPEGSTR